MRPTNLKEEAIFNPKRLREARLVRRMSISGLAEKIGVSKQAVSQYELGDSSPKVETMMNIINVLGFPKTFFYRDYKEQYVANTFFRANASATKKNKEVQLIKSYFAGYICDYLENIIEFPPLNLPDTSGFNDSNWDRELIEDLALQVREQWLLGDTPIPNIVNLLERNGIMVFSLRMDSDKIDAFCQHRKGRPFIFMGNDKQSAARRQFDGAHELGHRLMHEEIYNQDNLSKEERKIMEQEANSFASSLLLPADAFRKTVTSTTLLHFIELKKYWKVSIGAMLYRSRELGIIDENRYVSLVKQMSMKKIRVKEPLDDLIPISEPVVLKKSIEMLLQNDVKSEQQIVYEIGLPQEYIEILCNIESGTLNPKESEPIIRLL